MAIANVTYCRECGCYIPDNWIECPACHQYVMSTQSSLLAQAVLRGDRIQSVLSMKVSPEEPRERADYPGELRYATNTERMFVADESLDWVYLSRSYALDRYKLNQLRRSYNGFLGNASIDEIVSGVEELAERCKL